MVLPLSPPSGWSQSRARWPVADVRHSGRGCLRATISVLGFLLAWPVALVSTVLGTLAYATGHGDVVRAAALGVLCGLCLFAGGVAGGRAPTIALVLFLGAAALGLVAGQTPWLWGDVWAAVALSLALLAYLARREQGRERRLHAAMAEAARRATPPRND